jgi:hypothetical protein
MDGNVLILASLRQNTATEGQAIQIVLHLSNCLVSVARFSRWNPKVRDGSVLDSIDRRDTPLIARRLGIVTPDLELRCR